MLRTVRVPGQDSEQDHLLRPRPVVFGHQSFDELFVTFDDSGLSPNFHAFPMCVVDEEQKRLRIIAEIALRDVLAIARKIDKDQWALVDHTQETRGTVARLRV